MVKLVFEMTEVGVKGWFLFNNIKWLASLTNDDPLYSPCCLTIFMGKSTLNAHTYSSCDYFGTEKWSVRIDKIDGEERIVFVSGQPSVMTESFRGWLVFCAI